MARLRQLLRKIIAFLLSDMNREILIFLFFLFMSCIFWVLETLNRNYEMEFFFPITIENLPDNAIITSDIPKDLKVTIKGKGIFLLQYQYLSKPSSVRIDFDDYKDLKKNRTIHITSTELRKRIARNLESSSIVSFKPDNFDLSFTTGKAKKVPVQLNGTISAKNQYDITSVEFVPDSVTVYAKQKSLDTISSVLTSEIMFSDLDKSASFITDLAQIKNAKAVPSDVKVKVSVAQITQKSIEVPIVTTNVPYGKVLRIFPARAKVTFQIALPFYKYVNQEDFIIVADARNIKDGKCPLEIKKQPDKIKYLSIYPENVEYLIENE